ncbi:hypothetical protein SDC9_161879 [bioreactor metagenome]|uniref:Uncharacterized protein n=1 Tax=bioreactor metagenome TaxID=1076179 RepID=A0A645FLW5_9ZZZZ
MLSEQLDTYPDAPALKTAGKIEEKWASKDDLSDKNRGAEMFRAPVCLFFYISGGYLAEGSAL